jgi:malate dehydrogenase (oxaloacetate-decarboxylating)
VQVVGSKIIHRCVALTAVAAPLAQDVARQAQADGVADPCDAATLDARIAARVWEPEYRPYRKIG